MIKVDIVNEVSRLAEITKVKAELAVDAVFEAMRHSMQRGERIELRGFGVFQVKPGALLPARLEGEIRLAPGRWERQRLVARLVHLRTIRCVEVLCLV